MNIIRKMMENPVLIVVIFALFAITDNLDFHSVFNRHYASCDEFSPYHAEHYDSDRFDFRNRHGSGRFYRYD